jgi:putative transcriptional regulator
MIRYKGDILGRLKDKGYSTYKIKEEKIFNQSQVQQIRDDKLLTQDALNKLCRLLDCQPGDLMEYIPDIEQMENEVE